jgi:hypothetical protein
MLMHSLAGARLEQATPCASVTWLVLQPQRSASESATMSRSFRAASRQALPTMKVSRLE